MKKYLLLLLLVFLIPIKVLANETVNIYVFHNQECPHCKRAITYLNELQENDANIKIYTYEISQETNAYNRTLFHKAEEALDIEVMSVPFVVIGNNYYIGFNDNFKDTYVETINFYKNNNYKDKVGIALGLIDDNTNEEISLENKDYKLDIPLLGTIDLKKLSLPVISIVIGLVDGFNPCAMWVLIFLITILFNIKDKRKMWILGLTFILASAFVYFLFMMAWLKMSDFVNSVSTLKIIISLFAITFGIINVYKYFKERKSDGCNIVSKEKRKVIFKNIKKIVESKYFILSIIGIIILATIINLVELLCSMGLPVMFTEILSLNNLGKNAYLGYIILYIFFFMLDDIIVFVLSMCTLKSTAISTKYNKYSHLIGGIIMIIIGLLIIFKPEWLAFNFQ